LPGKAGSENVLDKESRKLISVSGIGRFGHMQVICGSNRTVHVGNDVLRTETMDGKAFFGIFFPDGIDGFLVIL
jgi:hypothetical protein